MMNKYPVHKVAKDFKKGSKEVPSKEVMDILAQYGHPQKNHMQPLNDEQLSIVFEYLTQHNQVESFEAAPKETSKPAAQKSTQPSKQAHNKQQETVSSRVPTKKVVDTRGGGSVNLDKYDERLESFTDQRQ